MQKIIITIFLLIIVSYSTNAQSEEKTEPSKVIFSLDASTWFVSGGVTYNADVLLYDPKESRYQFYGKFGYFNGYSLRLIFESGDLDGFYGGFTFLEKMGNHYLEMNFGIYHLEETKIITSFFDEPKIFENKKLYPMIRLGYRYQHPTNGLVIKTNIGYMGFGVGVGYAF